MRIDIVADLTCPWCYIGKRRLERALAMRPALEVERVWRPFQLNPELAPAGVPRDLYLQLKFGGGRAAARMQAALTAAGLREGIALAFDRIHRTPNTVNAHRLIRLAAAADRSEPVVEALYRGYFVDGIDIGNLDALAAIAAACGLDRRLTRTMLAGDAGVTEVLAEEHRARRTGIEAVPCFIIEGDYALAGAQDAEMFLPLFDLAAGPRESAAAD
ncbi:MAG TPA: DsbA family oxidoreductase [Stellaceae bacterium]|jgi:predicted DsbA family dithiol-disulfide isomerase|nr:DsbA family oxidoreductase [Stellaceae bacterium]